MQDLQRHINAGAMRWPRIQWSAQDYAEHYGRIWADGTGPAHPVDLYLAGAAGHRVDPAWEAIHIEIGPEARAILGRRPIADLTVDDLWAEAVVNLLDADPDQPPMPDGRTHARIIRYQGLVKLMHYFVTVAHRIAIRRHRQSKPMYLANEDILAMQVDDPAQSPDQEAGDRELLDRVTAALAEAYGRLSAEQRFLLRMTYDQGMLQKDAGRIMGLSEFATHRRIKSAIETLRQGLDGICGPDQAVVAPQVWEQAWTLLQRQAGIEPKESRS